MAARTDHEARAASPPRPGHSEAPTPPDAPAPSPDAAASLDQDFAACLALRHIAGLGTRGARRLLDHYGQAAKALADCRAWDGLGLTRQGPARAAASGAWRRAAETERAMAAGKNLSAISWGHPAYPDLLREIADPPLLLYVLGDLDLLANPGVAVVGARRCSRYGFESAARLSAELSAAGLTVISGLAHGIDRQAHIGGLSGVGRSIAVLGTGLDLVYPDTNLDVWKALAEHGLILSEFAPGTPARPAHFPIRNRVISGLSLAVVVIEAAARSGSLITARLAAEQGREVLAMPGPVTLPTFEGCHDLIGKGAYLARSAEDVLAALGPRLRREISGARSVRRAAPVRPGRAPSPPSPPPPSGPDIVETVPGPPERLTETEAGILDRLRGGRLHIDVLARELGLASAVASRTLLALELRGLVRKWPGMYYGVEQ